MSRCRAVLSLDVSRSLRCVAEKYRLGLRARAASQRGLLRRVARRTALPVPRWLRGGCGFPSAGALRAGPPAPWRPSGLSFPRPLQPGLCPVLSLQHWARQDGGLFSWVVHERSVLYVSSTWVARCVWVAVPALGGCALFVPSAPKPARGQGHQGRLRAPLGRGFSSVASLLEGGPRRRGGEKRGPGVGWRPQ